MMTSSHSLELLHSRISHPAVYSPGFAMVYTFYSRPFYNYHHSLVDREDRMVAATTLHEDEPAVPRNTSHFERLTDLDRR